MHAKAVWLILAFAAINIELLQIVKRLFLIVLLFFVADIGRYVFYPDVSWLQKNNPIPTAFMRNYTERRQNEGKSGKITQNWVSLRAISPYIIKAVLISEDDGFYNHEGFEIAELEEALQKNIKAGKFVVGGSTVSQQLAKNIYLTPSKNPIRKIKEAILTYRMEKTLSKRRILELYLNCAQWGDGIFGIEAAARHYYGKSAKALNAKEAAALASVLPNPIIYHPGDGGRVSKKTAIIYNIMVRRGIVVKDFEEIVKPQVQETPESEQTQMQEDSNVSEDVNKSL